MWFWKSAYSKYADGKYGKYRMLVGFGHLGQCVMACWSHDSRLISLRFGQCAKWRWADVLRSLTPGRNMTQLRAQGCLNNVTSYLQWQMANPWPVSMLQWELIKRKDAQPQGKLLEVGDERAGNMHWVTICLNGVKRWCEKPLHANAASEKCHMHIFEHLQ